VLTRACVPDIAIERQSAMCLMVSLAYLTKSMSLVYVKLLQAESGGSDDGIIQEYYTLSEWASSINTPLLAQAFRYTAQYHYMHLKQTNKCMYTLRVRCTTCLQALCLHTVM
jgi:hypothetical protein